jgi:cytochrome P450
MRLRKLSVAMMHPLASTDQLSQRFTHFKQLRETTPLLYDDATQRWHVFRYADALQVLTDTNRFAPTGFDHASLPTFASNNDVALPRWQVVRVLVRQAAPPRLAAQLTPQIMSTAQALLDRSRPLGTLDVIGDLAAPLSVAVSAQLLGVPLEQRQRFTYWMDVLGAGQVTTHDALWPDAEPNGAVTAAAKELTAYLAQMLEERRRRPLDDLIGRLLACEVNGNRLREPEIIAWCSMFLLASHATATHLLGNAVLCLSDHPEVIARLRHQPPPIYSTVEEALRYLPPVWNAIRVTTTDVTLSGQRIPTQAQLCVWVASANRDADYFPNPDRFDIERIPNRHLSLSYGSRGDLAPALARRMARSTLTMLVKALPNLKRVSDGALEVIGGSSFFGLKRLPVAFTPS